MMRVEQAPDGFTWTREAWGRGLRADALARVAPHVFSTRDLATAPEAGEWHAVAAAIGAQTLVRLRQVHGADVVAIRRGAPPADPAGRPCADILISDDPAVAIAVQAADCVPFLMADSRSGAVAAAHAGWRGMVARVPQRAVAALADAFGARPHDLLVAVGPSIGPCCYEVGPELVAAFADAGFDNEERRRWFTRGRADRLQLNLWMTATDQLIAVGVPPANIALARLCTADRADLFPSYRRDRDRAGRLAAAIRAAD